jgi:hypothetical protein
VGISLIPGKVPFQRGFARIAISLLSLPPPLGCPAHKDYPKDEAEKELKDEEKGARKMLEEEGEKKDGKDASNEEQAENPSKAATKRASKIANWERKREKAHVLARGVLRSSLVRHRVRWVARTVLFIAFLPA